MAGIARSAAVSCSVSDRISAISVSANLISRRAHSIAVMALSDIAVSTRGALLRSIEDFADTEASVGIAAFGAIAGSATIEVFAIGVSVAVGTEPLKA